MAEVLEGDHLMFCDERTDYGEERWIAIGETQGRTVCAALVFRGADRVRVISLRKAARRERALFFSTLANRLGQG